MSITPIDKVKIMKYLRENPIGEIYYLDLCDALGKRGKIKDIEFLEFFVEAVIKEFKKDEKISIKQVSKLVATVESFLIWVNEAGVEVDSVLLDRIRAFEAYYDEYLNRTNYDIDLEFTDTYLADLISTINRLYPVEELSDEDNSLEENGETKNSTSVLQYLNRIDELDSQYKTLKKEYDDVLRLSESLQAKYDKKVSDFTKKSEELARCSQLVENKDREIDRLNESIVSLGERIKELEDALSSATSEIEVLTEFRTKYEFTLAELKSVKKELEARDRACNEAILQRNTDSMIESLIYQKLLVEGANINQILDYLKNSGYTLDKNYVYNLLNRMKSKINLVNGTFSLSPTYKVVAPQILESGVFDIGINPGTKRYDIMLVSDFHLREINDKAISGMSSIYDYCAGHDINLILNLGDYYDYLGGGSDLENASANYRLVSDTISLMPKSDGIYQAILGGNHDKRVLKYGFDPIEMVAREREDYINLGYSHATVTLNGSKSVLNSFDLHHPNRMAFNLTLGNDGVDSENILTYLNEIYSGIGRNRDDSFVDLFGHTHKSQFNFMDSYCFIPSFFEGKSRKGACHLRIYLDEETQIKYMVFMPLSVTDKFTKQTEIVYQKVLNR